MHMIEECCGKQICEECRKECEVKELLKDVEKELKELNEGIDLPSLEPLHDLTL